MAAESNEVVEALRTALIDLEQARQVNEQLASRGNEPIAIVGMSCRYPGGVCSPQALWSLLEGQNDAISEFPDDRGWDLERLYDPDPDHAGTSYARRGGFIDAVGSFDAQFFGIGPREALAMDPQQRLLLEVAWEAFEDAGIDPVSRRGTATGVFAGISAIDHDLGGHSRPKELEDYLSVGALGSIISGRVAYVFGLEGPAISVDTACSSSLVAIHLASQALRAGECSLALAGGVTVFTTPTVFVAFSRQRGLSADGRCRSFGAGADGVGFSEGVGLLLLERVSDARRNGHEILALVRGSAVNQDGASNGLTAPNGPSQQSVIVQALANAGLTASEVDAVEAHGTGTTLGDPIEAQSLLTTYGRERERPLWLGSVKSNIGHTQAAAGVAGVIKMVQAMRHGLLPKTLHAEEPTPHVDWTEGNVKLLRLPIAWPKSEQPRRAGVSSFGISGTNAHLILEETPDEQRQHPKQTPTPAASPLAEGSAAPDADSFPPPALLVTANSAAALGEQAGRLCSHLEQHPGLAPLDVAFSLTTRSRFEHRAVVLGEDRDALRVGLRALASGQDCDELIRGVARSDGKLAFAFTGQGAQWAGMGRELYRAFPVFARELDAVCAALDPHLVRPLTEVMFAAEGSVEASLLDWTQFAQPALFAVEVALYALLGSFGVTPDYLIGHSIGELSAAYVAGVLSLPDACTLVAARGRLMGALPAGGAMAAIEASEEEVRDGLDPCLSVAGVNAPRAVVVSGEDEALAALESHWSSLGRRTSRLRVSHAFHSRLMTPMLEEFKAVAESIQFQAPSLPIVSNVSGELAGAELSSPDYWVSHVRETVRFADGIATLARAGVTRFLELGPDATLTAMADQCLGEQQQDTLLAAALRRHRPQLSTFVAFLAQAITHGVDVDWAALFAGSGARRTALPTYPFQRRRYWLASGSGDVGALGQSATGHPFLGAAVALAGDRGLLFTGRLSLQSHPWLKGHMLGDTVLLPGTGFVELALAAARGAGSRTLEELTLRVPLVLEQDGATQLQVTVADADADGRRELAIYSRRECAEDREQAQTPWVQHASGVIGAESEDPRGGDGDGLSPELERFGGVTWPPPGADELDSSLLYERLAEIGYCYGPSFQGLRRAWMRDGELYAEVVLAPELVADGARFCVHPALFDSAFHAALQVALTGQAGETQVYVPFSYSRVRLHQAGTSSWRVRAVSDGEGSMTVQVLDLDGVAVASVETIAGRPLDLDRLAPRQAQRDLLFELQWVRSAAQSVAPVSMTAVGEVVVPGVELERFADLPAFARAVDAGAQAPGVVFVGCACGDRQAVGTIAAVRANARRALALAQAFLADERFASSRLVFVTERALVAGAGESPGLAQAALLGLVRSACSEHLERFGLVDCDGTAIAPGALADAFAGGDGELAVRQGQVLLARLSRLSSDAEQAAIAYDPDATVLITGGTGGLGTLLARHLVSAHGVEHLLLASRRGPEAPGALALRSELEELGCETRIEACDFAQRDQVEALLSSIPQSSPLGSVIHAAGALDNGLIESLDGDRLDRVLAPKLDGAVHLHELTEGMELSQFVLFSSVAGTWGGPGQASYAAANAFLDALAAHRRARGLAAQSLVWGPWEQRTGLFGDRDGAEDARLLNQIRAHMAMAPLAGEQGLRLFDAACASGRPLVIAARLEMAALRSQARSGMLPALARSLVSVPARQGSERSRAFVQRLAAAEGEQRDALVLALVRSQVAGVLGHSSAEAIDPERAFRELGFDSLGATELRRRLAHATGLRLPSTLAFDYPNSTALASYLREQAEGTAQQQPTAVRSRVDAEEPIAIVGSSCRYPGGVRCAEELWELLAEGGDAISELPSDRGWNLDALYDPDPDRRGTIYSRNGGFIYDAPDFDAGFFGISPREATAMDPHQRLLLEGSWEGLEDAGIDPQRLRGAQVGVFAGVMTYDYGAGSLNAVREGFDTGNIGGGVASGRVSYTLGFEGPAVTVDTACSSSLVAIHLACQALRSGECELALAGGATVLATPGMLLYFSRQRGLAPDGRCKAFGAGADGTGFSDGMGLVVLERLSDARRNGRRILGLVRGSAVNQDGASNGLTAPNGPSQERVIRTALASAGLAPTDIDAVEAHGTGTVLGDPIEAQALLATYGQGRPEGRPVWLGSIKSNIGHTQAAAGVAGVIKMLMAMRHGMLPRSLHVQAPSEHVDWSAGSAELLKEAVRWQPDGAPRRAGVSSFGASGTNAHLILEEAVHQPSGRVNGAVGDRGAELDAGAGPDAGAGSDAGAELDAGASLDALPFVVTAKSDGALREQAARIAARLRAQPQLAELDVAFSLAARSRFEHRAVIVAGGREALLAGLDGVSREGSVEGAIEGVARRGGKLAIAFTGQGSQWQGMGRELHAAFPVFAEAFDAACAEFDRLLDRPLEETVFAPEHSPSESLLDRTELTQPALFALEVALYRLTASFGVIPDYLIGHSIGELVAAHVAGVLSLHDAAVLVAARGRLMGSLPAGGAMVSVEASEQEMLASIDGLHERVSIAALNGPTSVVLSGEAEAVAELESDWAARGRKTKRLRVSHAFHSPLMQPMLEQLGEHAGELAFHAPSLPIVSNLSGELAGPELADPGYWVAHAREPVRFADGLATLEREGVTAFLELGPDTTLCAMTQRCLSEERQQHALLTGALRPRQPEVTAFLDLLARAFAHGVNVDWEALFAGHGARRVELPAYAFQRQRHWLSSGGGAGNADALGQCSAEHPLLGAAVALAGEPFGWLLTGRMSLDSHPWLADHRLADTVVLPASGCFELALAAAQRVGSRGVAELSLQAPLTLDEQTAVQLQVTVAGPDAGGRRPLAIYSRRELAAEDAASADQWVCHATGVLEADTEAKAPHGVSELSPALERFAAEPWPPPGARELDRELLYARLAEVGHAYGPSFRALRGAWVLGEDLYAEVALESPADAEGFYVHPALLDSALHVALLAAVEVQGSSAPEIPCSFSRARLHARGASSLRARVHVNGAAAAGVDSPCVLALDGHGAPALSIESLRTRAHAHPAHAVQSHAGAGELLGSQWLELRGPAQASPVGSLARRLAGAPESEREAIALELVRGHVARVLGHATPAAVDVERTFNELGLESQGALELHSRLTVASELRLPASLVFDHPSPLAVARDLRARAEGTERRAVLETTQPPRTDEPVAIVGMSCRLPGAVSSPEELWELLARGGDAVSEFPEDRGWELARLYDPDPAHAGTSYTRWGGFIDGLDRFDAEFFGIGASEALAMDPQQRLLLEGAWEAIEHAGIDPASLRGGDTGVFAGGAFSGYGLGASLPRESEVYRLTGGATSLISGRLAYAFGLEGPAVSIDTACSSSLVAIHMACQALRAGECAMALAGGVTALATPAIFVEFARIHGLSPDGRCKPFGAGADGAGFAEGMGLLLLERLSDARRNGHRVLALVRGSAVNQDGASNGLTAHSGPSQERVIGRALANAGLVAADIDAIEAHSTGTPLGDPIEAEALIAAYGRGRDGRPLHLGTLKSNIGHTQAAAGVAGVIKMVQALRHQALPKTLHAEEPSPHVDWSGGELALLRSPVPWPVSDRPRRAGISSFGISGTNAHLILEEAPAELEPDREPVGGSSMLAFLVSGNGRPALAAQAERLYLYLEAHPELDLVDVAATLALRRGYLSERAAILADARDQLLAGLRALMLEEPAESLIRGAARREGKLAFVFPGGGLGVAAMCRQLYESSSAFAGAIDEICEALDGHLERQLKDALMAAKGSPEAALLDGPGYSELAQFACELALHRLLRSFGLAPDYLLGHAIGELAAAHAGGVLSLDDACALAAGRARLIEAGGDAAESALVAAELQALSDALVSAATRITLLSSASGEPLSSAVLASSAHWVEVASGAGYEDGEPVEEHGGLAAGVRFADSARFLGEQGVTRFLELGPDTAVVDAIVAQIAGELTGRTQFSCGARRDSNEGGLLGLLARLHVHGAVVDWRAAFPSSGHRHVDLPAYAFQRKSYWLSARAEMVQAGSAERGASDDELAVSAGVEKG